MMIAYIKLSLHQRQELKKFFMAVQDANKAGKHAAIGAQIWEDGMRVKLFNDHQGRKLSAALGGNWDVGHSSMASRRSRK